MWVQPMQTLSHIPGVKLGLDWIRIIDDLDHPCIAQWLKQHGQLISHLSAEVAVDENGLKLRDFCEAAAPCSSMNLSIRHSSNQVVDLAGLNQVASSLLSVSFCVTTFGALGTIRGAGVFIDFSRLTSLHLGEGDLGSEEPWGVLAKLTSLQTLSLRVCASGDPSPLSALTRLTYLGLHSYTREVQGPGPFSFSSLQTLSTLQQLEVLKLGRHACAVTASLQGLAGLSNLKVLGLDRVASAYGGMLTSLEGISPGIVDLNIECARDLVSLSGIEGCRSLEKVLLYRCGVPSLQPLKGLSSMKEVVVLECCITSLEGLASVSLEVLSLVGCRDLIELSGLEHLPALERLKVTLCGVTSLQPLSELRNGLKLLQVYANRHVQEEVLEMPHVQPTANVLIIESDVREVVLAGGVRRAVNDGGN
jgi:hypothetical protein